MPLLAGPPVEFAGRFYDTAPCCTPPSKPGRAAVLATFPKDQYPDQGS